VPSRYVATLKRLLAERADPKVKASYEWYFKGTLPFVGVKMPGIRSVFRDAQPLLRDMPVDRVIADAFTLLRARHGEEKQLGVMTLHRVRKQLPADFVRRLEPVFDTSVKEWGSCDAVSGRILRHLVVSRPSDRKRIVAWSRSRNTWRQRAAAVAFVNEARHGHHTRDIMTVCERIVRTPERFTQLGMGWVLRELWLAEPELVVGFLRRHYPQISREGLRYAIEKMPAALQGQLLAEHRVARR
jgi:3-methyladenine DNA glycosylase AlkD